MHEKVIIKLYSYPLSCIDINSNGSGEMKKKLLAGLITGFFIFIMSGITNATTIAPVADPNGPYVVM